MGCAGNDLAPQRQQLEIVGAHAHGGADAPVTALLEITNEPLAVSAQMHMGVDHRREASISDSELRDLTPENRRRVVALRDGYEAIFRDIIRRGTEFNYWDAEPRLAGFIVMAMCTGVSTWYRPGGPLNLEQIADHYTDFVVRALGAVAGGCSLAKPRQPQ